MFIATLLFVTSSQNPDAAPITVSLTPHSPAPNAELRWSPKGAAVALTVQGSALVGKFALGPEGLPQIAVKLTKSPGVGWFDQLWIDIDRDGRFADSEKFTTTPKEQRGKWWSSFDVELSIPVPAEKDAKPATRSYPVALWFVEDPLEADAKPALRWSRRGWHEGEVQIGDQKAFVMVTEMTMDGVFDQRDSWALSRDHAKLLASTPRGLDEHVWLDGIAYLPVKIDPHGRSLSFQRVDAGITEAEEAAKKDIYAADRNAPRAEKPLEFGKDFEAAITRAKRENKRVLVDFETTWCGPCHTMNQIVYTAAAVVTAAKDVIAVKLDGDEQRELVKKFVVGGYPTIILLESDGKEVRRAVGYQGVTAMVELLKP